MKLDSRFHFPARLPAWGCVLAAALALGAAQAAEPFRFHHENILGTSLDLQVSAADEKQAAAVETAVLTEIERLRKILSSYDATSEISRLNQATAPMVCSQEVVDVLSAYDGWQAKSNGAYNGHLGALIDLWSKAGKQGALPADAQLKDVVKTLPGSGWRIDPATRTVTRLSAPGTLNINSLGKGYILTKAAVAARKAVPTMTGVLVNIGGDLFASGRSPAGTPWEVGVADPKHSEDNARPLTKVYLTDRAISTSAAYERGYDLGGKHYSHILDPRTGMPAEGVASATVIANNNASANAMATTLCVLKPEEGLALVKAYPGAECLIIGADGHEYRSDHFASLEGASSGPVVTATPTAPTSSVSGSSWPNGYQVGIAIDLKQPEAGGKKIKRPFVAVWVDDSTGKRVRTVTVWGKERKYLPELRAWWTQAKANEAWAATVTRATRNAGHHRIEWDGKDDQGHALPPGTYTITLEINREHGTYAVQHGQIVCGSAPAKGTIGETDEAGETQLTYGPGGQ